MLFIQFRLNFAFGFEETFGNKMNVFHHIIEIRGTIYDKTVDVGLIEGVERDSATLMTPDTDVLFEKLTGIAVVVPTVTNILAVKNIEEIKALTNGTTTYKPRNVIPIAPALRAVSLLRVAHPTLFRVGVMIGCRLIMF